MKVQPPLRTEARREKVPAASLPDRGPSTNSQPAVKVHIEQLILDGIEPGKRDAIGNAVQRTLAELIEQGSLPANWSMTAEIADLDAGSIHVADDATGEATGIEIAKAVYGGNIP
jgi:hypothetical protein